MTPEERKELLRPVQIRNVVYFGAIWGGVQVIDKFMKETEEELMQQGQTEEYSGIYSGLAALEMAMLERESEA